MLQKVYIVTYEELVIALHKVIHHLGNDAMGDILHYLVFLLVYTAFTNGRVELYIAPSLDSSCPQGPCLSLLLVQATTRTKLSMCFHQVTMTL